MKIITDETVRTGLRKAGDVAVEIVNTMKLKAALTDTRMTCRDIFERNAEHMSPEEYIKGVKYFQQLNYEKGIKDTLTNDLDYLI